MNPEKELKALKTEQSRLTRLFYIPGFILFAFVIFSSSPTLVKLIAPLSVGTAMILLCVIDIAIAVPLAIKMDKVKKQIQALMEKSPKKKDT